jgi:hypothetical protein
MYSVVEFTDTRTVDVVATCWICDDSESGELVCLWPKKKNNVTKLARDLVAPNKRKMVQLQLQNFVSVRSVAIYYNVNDYE